MSLIKFFLKPQPTDIPLITFKDYTDYTSSELYDSNDEWQKISESDTEISEDWEEIYEGDCYEDKQVPQTFIRDSKASKKLLEDAFKDAFDT